MKQNRNHLTKKSIFFISVSLCLLILLFINQKPITKAQTVETKRDKPELVVQTGHTTPILSVAFSPDGKTLASGGADVKLWNIETGRQIRSLGGHTLFVNSVTFSPDGKIIASGSWDQTIKLWNTETGELLKSLESKNWEVNSVTFSPDGKILASGSLDKTVKLWSVETGKLIKSFVGHTNSVTSVAFSPDGLTLVSGGYDNVIKLWNVKTGTLLKSFKGHIDGVNSVIFSLNGKTLVSVSQDKTVKLWNIQTGQLLKSLAGHKAPVQSVTFSRDGQILVTGSDDGIIKFWNIQTGQPIKSLNAHRKSAASIEFSPDGKTFASGSHDSQIKLWDFETSRELKSLEGHAFSIKSLDISPDGKKIASTSVNIIDIWSAETGERISSFENTAYIKSAKFSPDGRIIASGDSNNSIKLWDVETGQQLLSLNGHDSTDTYTTKDIYSIDFSPDSKIIASLVGDNSIKIWEIESGILLNTFKIDTWFYGIATFSPDGKTLVSSSTDRTIKILDVETGEIIKSLPGPYNGISPIVFSPDGKTIAAGSEEEDNAIKLWNIETGQEVRSLLGHTGTVESLAFSHDGKTLVSGSWDTTIKLWDVESGNQIENFQGHTNWVTGIVFSQDGKMLVSGSLDTTIKFWNIRTSEILTTLIPLDINYWTITTPDGRFDTNEDLNKIESLIWVLPDQPLTPKPLELYMRQYYEPGLLPRVLRCTEEGNCDTEFKPLPSIAEINRVQPKVEIREIKSKANNADLVDVVVEVESRTEEIAQKRLTSGVFDLRLFRDGQLVGTSAKSADLEEYINSAPQAIEKDRAAKSLLNTEEDKAWRKANDLQKVVKFDKNKATFVFENVRLTHDGRKAVEFSAYAFNDDRVKSETSQKTFEISKPTVRVGNTYLVSIGVNASENPAYKLNYAAVDARKTQEILGERLKAKLSGTSSKLIQINLVSDYAEDGKINEKTATKPNIEALFNLLAGKSDKPADFFALVNGQKITAAQIPAVQPEDTLIITYSGHGYADANGIFYLLPYDIGANTEKLTTEVLPKLVSSDELSLWMRDVTAREMLMIVDACHSSAAVQGDGFKPGPMASRGLGQLAYDKGMKILSATQANNVALELGGSLKQGLLSYALLQDGIFSKFADTDSNKQLFIKEWLKYGEKRVPALYEGIKNGTIKSVTIDNKPLTETQRSGIYYVDKNRKQTLQEPKLFDFNEKREDKLLINLP